MASLPCHQHAKINVAVWLLTSKHLLHL